MALFLELARRRWFYYAWSPTSFAYFRIQWTNPSVFSVLSLWLRTSSRDKLSIAALPSLTVMVVNVLQNLLVNASLLCLNNTLSSKPMLWVQSVKVSLLILLPISSIHDFGWTCLGRERGIRTFCKMEGTETPGRAPRQTSCQSLCRCSPTHLMIIIESNSSYKLSCTCFLTSTKHQVDRSSTSGDTCATAAKRHRQMGPNHFHRLFCSKFNR